MYGKATLHIDRIILVQDQYAPRPQTIRFTGPPPANAAAAFDGIVDIEFHWEFSDRRQR